MGTMESDIFKEEAYDLLDDIEAALLDLRDNSADRELINRLFRDFHTIKGSGAMFGFKAVSKFTHEIETAIDKIREGTGVIPDSLRETLLTARDQILIMIDSEDPNAPEIQESAQRILSQLKPSETPAQKQVQEPASEPAQTPTPTTEQSIATRPPAPKATPQPPPQNKMDEDAEAQALANELEELLLEVPKILHSLAKDPDSAKLRKKLYRSIHTVHGTAAMYEMPLLAEFSGGLAEIADTIKQGNAGISDELIEKFESALEHCSALIRSPDPSGQILQRRSTKFTAELSAIINPKAAKSGPNAKPLRFLIVEDEFTSRYLLQEFLTPYGHSHVAIDGFEAILAFKSALIEKKPYNIIFLDIMMPGLDGRDVAKEIRRLEQEILGGASCKVVMTTALDDPDIKDTLLTAKHCDAYLTKPLNFDEIMGLLKSYFSI